MLDTFFPLYFYIFYNVDIAYLTWNGYFQKLVRIVRKHSLYNSSLFLLFFNKNLFASPQKGVAGFAEDYLCT